MSNAVTKHVAGYHRYFATATDRMDECGPWSLIGETQQIGSNGMVKVGEIDGCTIETQPGGTCDRCGMGIVVVIAVVCAKGIAHVGTDCAETLLGVGKPNAIARVKKIANEHTKAVTAARAAARLAACKALLDNDAIWAQLEALPNPNRAGESLASWCTWMLRHAGTKGAMQVCRVVESVAKTGAPPARRIAA